MQELTRCDIVLAWAKIKKANIIPDEVLFFMKFASLEKIKRGQEAQERDATQAPSSKEEGNK
jgi:hypothetical protein